MKIEHQDAMRSDILKGERPNSTCKGNESNRRIENHSMDKQNRYDE